MNLQVHIIIFFNEDLKKENQSEEEDNKDVKVSKENHSFKEQKNR